jgi:hypothetical protein
MALPLVEDCGDRLAVKSGQGQAKFYFSICLLAIQIKYFRIIKIYLNLVNLREPDTGYMVVTILQT